MKFAPIVKLMCANFRLNRFLAGKVVSCDARDMRDSRSLS